MFFSQSNAIVPNFGTIAFAKEEIKCNYHPVINETEILGKYYPLEIIEYSNEIKGFITNYELVEFSLK